MNLARRKYDRADPLPPGVSTHAQSLGREIVLLGAVQVGEIIAIERGRFTAAYRLILPDSAVSTWRPASDSAAARRALLEHLDDWLNAAGVVSAGSRGRRA